MPRLWDLLNPDSKQALKTLMAEKGADRWNPDAVKPKPKVEVRAKLEDLEELTEIMKLSPEEFKHIKEE